MLIKQLFIQNIIVHVETEQWLLSQIVTLKVQACVTLCCHWMSTISKEFWALWTELCYSFLQCCNILESVTTKCIPRGLTRWKWLGPKARLYGWRSSHSHPSCCNSASFCQAVLGYGIKWLYYFRPAEEALWWSQMPSWYRNSRSCLTVVPLATARILCWRHIFTGNTLWQVPETAGWLCGKEEYVGHCSVLLWEMQFWIKSLWISKYSPCILTLRSTFIISSVLIELNIYYHQCQCLPLHTNLSQSHPYPSFTTYFLKCALLLSSQIAFFKEVSPTKILNGSLVYSALRKHLKSFVSTMLSSLQSSQCLPSHNIKNFALLHPCFLWYYLPEYLGCEHLVISPQPPPHSPNWNKGPCFIFIQN